MFCGAVEEEIVRGCGCGTIRIVLS
jgi:hypothetical protein